MIKVIRLDQFMMVGEEESVMPATVISLINPRVIQANQQGQLVLAALVGSPMRVIVNKEYVIFSYELVDEALLASYRENVTGLIIAKKNVVDIGRVK